MIIFVRLEVKDWQYWMTPGFSVTTHCGMVWDATKTVRAALTNLLHDSVLAFQRASRMTWK